LTQRRLDLLARGFTPTPVDGKIPPMPGWQKKTNPTLDEVAAWERGYPHCRNTGVVCGRVGALDVDILRAEAAAEVEALARDRFGGRGRFLTRVGQPPKVAVLLRTIRPFEKISTTFRGGEKIEFLCSGQMLVVHGTHPDTKQPYTWPGEALWQVELEELPHITEEEAREFVKDAAKLLVEQFGYELKESDAAEHVSLEDAATDDVEKQKKLLDDVLTGSNYHDALIRLAAIFIANGMSEDATVTHLRALMEASSGPRDQRWQERHDDIPRAVSTAHEKFVEAKVTALNKEYAFVLAGDKGAVMKFEGRTFRLLKRDAFKGWFANKGEWRGKKFVTAADVWLGHPLRREYAGIEFDPAGTYIRKDYYNLWRGFAVEPREGDCSLFIKHIKDNVAQGDEVKFKWVMGWFADIFQNPGTKQGTSLVLRGGQGVGKTIVGKIIGSLIGSDHYDLVAAPRYIVGQFNAHMAALLLLHADEAFWAGDKRAEGVLKDLVTGHQHRIEFKGIDPVRVRNLIRLFITGNAEWVVPAAFDERRFAILDVADYHKQDHPYFAAIENQMDDGGREALLHHLLNFDLSTVNLRSTPKTQALLEQQIASMTPEQSWWLDVLRGGQLPRVVEVGNRQTKVKNSCFTGELYDSYIRHGRRQGVARRAIETRVGIFLVKAVGPDLDRKRDGSDGDSYYVFPPLKECRARFTETLGGADLKWDDREDWGHSAGDLFPDGWRTFR
jgi:hypothetical protein